MIHADGGVVKVDGDGSLTIQGPAVPSTNGPVSWDVLPDGTKRPLESHFVVDDGADYGFEVVGHNPTLPLVIDPNLVPAPTIVARPTAPASRALQRLLVVGHEQPQRRRRLQLAGEHLAHDDADRLPALGQQPDHPGRRQRPGERHLSGRSRRSTASSDAGAWSGGSRASRSRV